MATGWQWSKPLKKSEPKLVENSVGYFCYFYFFQKIFEHYEQHFEFVHLFQPR